MITKSVPARAHTRTFAVGVDYITEHTHQRGVAAAGATFEGGVTYASAPEKAAWVHLRGVTSVETAAIEMEAVAVLSARCRDPVYHLIIAYAKHERPTREQVVSDAERLLKAIGMDDHQYVLAAHKDTDDFHAHVIANRVGPDGHANDLWHERIVRERVGAEIAAERGWDIVAGRHNRDIVQRIERLHDLPAEPERRLSDGAYRRLHERGEPPWQEVARPYILDAVDRARDWNDLRQRLGAHGVVLKLVRRGERVQGLAFAEGFERTAAGCAASRIDARCAISALERRLGPFTPSHEPASSIARGTPWNDTVRPTILEAVDAANSWKDLRKRLDQHGIVVKLVERGGRVQGLAFAQGRHPDAPGCGASRIDPRCKKAALEQRFGPFPLDKQQRQEHSREAAVNGEARQRNQTLRDRAEQLGDSDPRWALREASRIADHARMRSAYAAYRDRFFAERSRALEARRNAAWERERAQRQLEARRRREARQLLRAVARLGARGFMARQVAYWSIDAVIARRRAQEHDVARVRWETTKIVLASERRVSRQEKIMDYRSFVTEKARVGDPAALRVLDALSAPARSQERTAPAELRRVSFNEVRARIEVIRAEEEVRYERSRAERAGLQRVAQPAALDDVLAVERKRIQEQTANATEFTDAERARLAQLAREKRSWNPLARAAATRAQAELRDAQRSRYDSAVAKAMREFEERVVPQIAKRVAAEERQYCQFATTSLDLEGQVRDARAALRDRIPQMEHRMHVLERAGVSQLEGWQPDANLRQLSAAIDRQYRVLPEAVRRDIESRIRSEHHNRDRSRESMSMGGR
jgi:Relaxase/Mobilisation nuclease domain